ncbi:MAG: tRNA (adenosine(37)-N6)-threonylcarbamoyltransferase complex dimerization subunit type 1 TsaB [bacterium]|nr:tRNA (adenosine(37)-N6)-threonylcarbamoyltransferase complex dimerization subunit type 1 TsaB [bacterium]
MKILAIECSAVAASCAIVCDRKLIGESFVNVKSTHSQTLLPMVESLLKNSSVNLSDIDVFAVSNGPGSFTGLRIGIAAIKGMAFGGENNCLGISSLMSMAYNLRATDCIVCAVMDARCNQVYNANFKVVDGKVQRLCQDRALFFEQLFEELSEMHHEMPIIVVGDGAELFLSKFSDRLPNLKIAPPESRYQRAASVAFAAEDVLDEQGCIGAQQLLPFYLRLPQAQRELNKKINKG